MHEVVVVSGAEADLLTAYCWFEAFDSRLAERFDSTIDEVLKRLEDFPELGAPFRGKYRRILVSGFTYGIFYAIDAPTRITIVAVLDLRQDPRMILRRLGLE